MSIWLKHPLLSFIRSFDKLTNKNNEEECVVDIQEDGRGGIKIIGVTKICHQHPRDHEMS